jgi:membrane-bound lytic murein transglycosylase B
LLIFIDNGIEFDVDPRLVIAIAGAETTFGTNMGCNAVFNAWSWFWTEESL